MRAANPSVAMNIIMAKPAARGAAAVVPSLKSGTTPGGGSNAGRLLRRSSMLRLRSTVCLELWNSKFLG